MLEFCLTRNGTPLYGNLLALKSDQLFHERHVIKLAHPADILSEKLGTLNRKLALVDNHRNDKPVAYDKKDSICNYILEIDSFYDSLFLIIKCLTEPSGTDNKDVTKWLTSINSRHSQNFIGATKQNHQLFRSMSNKIKHDHVGISTLTVDNHKNIPVHGFYIRSIVGEDDQRGPDPEIHRPYKDCVTAFSYNHFILYSVGCIFHYLEHLNKTLFNTKPKIKYQERNSFGILSACNSIAHDFFPDEYSRPYAFVKKNHDDDRILFKYPYRYRKSSNGELFQNIYRVYCHLEHNQRTSTFHGIMPYLPLIKR